VTPRTRWNWRRRVSGLPKPQRRAIEAIEAFSRSSSLGRQEGAGADRGHGGAPLDHVAPRIAGTYAFVNPVVAVLLGWWLLGERLDARILIGAAVIAAAVALIVLAPGRRSEPDRSAEAGGPDRRPAMSAQMPGEAP